MPFFMRSLLMLTSFFIFFCPHIEAEERIKISDSTPLSLVPPSEIYYRNVELNGKPYCLASLNKNRKSSELENVNYWTLKVNETKSTDPYVTHIKRGNFQLATTKWMRTFTHDVKLVHVTSDDKKSVFTSPGVPTRGPGKYAYMRTPREVHLHGTPTTVCPQKAPKEILSTAWALIPLYRLQVLGRLFKLKFGQAVNFSRRFFPHSLFTEVVMKMFAR